MSAPTGEPQFVPEPAPNSESEKTKVDSELGKVNQAKSRLFPNATLKFTKPSAGQEKAAFAPTASPLKPLPPTPEPSKAIDSAETEDQGFNVLVDDLEEDVVEFVKENTLAIDSSIFDELKTKVSETIDNVDKSSLDSATKESLKDRLNVLWASLYREQMQADKRAGSSPDAGPELTKEEQVYQAYDASVFELVTAVYSFVAAEPDDKADFNRQLNALAEQGSALSDKIKADPDLSDSDRQALESRLNRVGKRLVDAQFLASEKFRVQETEKDEEELVQVEEQIATLSNQRVKMEEDLGEFQEIKGNVKDNKYTDPDGIVSAYSDEQIVALDEKISLLKTQLDLSGEKIKVLEARQTELKNKLATAKAPAVAPAVVDGSSGSDTTPEPTASVPARPKNAWDILFEDSPRLRAIANTVWPLTATGAPAAPLSPAQGAALSTFVQQRKMQLNAAALADRSRIIRETAVAAEPFMNDIVTKLRTGEALNQEEVNLLASDIVDKGAQAAIIRQKLLNVTGKETILEVAKSRGFSIKESDSENLQGLTLDKIKGALPDWVKPFVAKSGINALIATILVCSNPVAASAIFGMTIGSSVATGIVEYARSRQERGMREKEVKGLVQDVIASQQYADKLQELRASGTATQTEINTAATNLVNALRETNKEALAQRNQLGSFKHNAKWFALGLFGSLTGAGLGAMANELLTGGISALTQSAIEKAATEGRTFNDLHQGQTHVVKYTAGAWRWIIEAKDVALTNAHAVLTGVTESGKHVVSSAGNVVGLGHAEYAKFAGRLGAEVAEKIGAEVWSTFTRQAAILIGTSLFSGGVYDAGREWSERRQTRTVNEAAKTLAAQFKNTVKEGEQVQRETAAAPSAVEQVRLDRESKIELYENMLRGDSLPIRVPREGESSWFPRVAHESQAQESKYVVGQVWVQKLDTDNDLVEFKEWKKNAAGGYAWIDATPMNVLDFAQKYQDEVAHADSDNVPTTAGLVPTPVGRPQAAEQPANPTRSAQNASATEASPGVGASPEKTSKLAELKKFVGKVEDVKFKRTKDGVRVIRVGKGNDQALVDNADIHFLDGLESLVSSKMDEEGDTQEENVKISDVRIVGGRLEFTLAQRPKAAPTEPASSGGGKK